MNYLDFYKEAIKSVARALGNLNDHVVFVGGAITWLYINDPAAENMRPTKDVDIVSNIFHYGDLEQFRRSLIEKGFRQSIEDHTTCRFHIGTLKVDVMSTQTIGWAPANPWFEAGFAHRELVHIDDFRIYILPFSYYLATKYSAFLGRGRVDPRTSHDFEDFIYILDNRTDFENLVQQSPSDVKDYLIKSFREIADDDRMKEAVFVHLSFDNQKERYNLLMNRLMSLIK